MVSARGIVIGSSDSFSAIVTVSSDFFSAEISSAPCACSFAEFLGPPFSPLSRCELEKYRFSSVFQSWFSFPLHYVPDGNVHPLPSAVCTFSERIFSRLWRSCIFRTYTFRFRVHATRVLVFFSCHLWTRLLLSGYRCAQLATDRSSLLFFNLGGFVRERLVRVLYFDPTVSVQFYLAGTSIVSVIAS